MLEEGVGAHQELVGRTLLYRCLNPLSPGYGSLGEVFAVAVLMHPSREAIEAIMA